MLYDVYGRHRVLIDDEHRAWLVGRDGKRSPIDDLVIPSDADGDEITDLLDVAFHEMARPGDKVIRIS
jgi:hypothetical protein